MGREAGLTKAITIIALTCFLVAGAAVTSILARTGMEASVAAMPAPVAKSPVANREAKQDRLPVARYALAAVTNPERADPPGLCLVLARRRRGREGGGRAAETRAAADGGAARNCFR
jgi:hypothetical protein